MQYYIYGTATTPDAPVYQYNLTDIRTIVRTSADPNARLMSSIRTINEPQVSGP